MNTTPGSDMVKSVRDVPAWRALVPIIFIGMAVMVIISRINALIHFMPAIPAACEKGLLLLAFYATSIRNLPSYWSIIWRLYLSYIGASFVFGLLSGSTVGATTALGVSIAVGVFFIPVSAALFFWDNIVTKIISYVLAVLLVLALYLLFVP
jgi:hypothetical protein